MLNVLKTLLSIKPHINNDNFLTIQNFEELNNFNRSKEHHFLHEALQNKNYPVIVHALKLYQDQSWFQTLCDNHNVMKSLIEEDVFLRFHIEPTYYVVHGLLTYPHPSYEERETIARYLTHHRIPIVQYNLSKAIQPLQKIHLLHQDITWFNFFESYEMMDESIEKGTITILRNFHNIQFHTNYFYDKPYVSLALPQKKYTLEPSEIEFFEDEMQTLWHNIIMPNSMWNYSELLLHRFQAVETYEVSLRNMLDWLSHLPLNHELIRCDVQFWRNFEQLWQYFPSIIVFDNELALSIGSVTIKHTSGMARFINNMTLDMYERYILRTNVHKIMCQLQPEMHVIETLHEMLNKRDKICHILNSHPHQDLEEMDLHI